MTVTIPYRWRQAVSISCFFMLFGLFLVYECCVICVCVLGFILYSAVSNHIKYKGKGNKLKVNIDCAPQICFFIHIMLIINFNSNFNFLYKYG